MSLELRKEAERKKPLREKSAEIFARDYNFNGEFRNVTESLIDEKVLTEEELGKGAWANFAEGNFRAWEIESLGFIFDLAPDMVKAAGATYLGGPSAAALVFGVEAGSETAGEYASRPEVSRSIRDGVPSRCNRRRCNQNLLRPSNQAGWID